MIKYKALRKEVTKYWKTSYEPNGIAVGGTFDADRQTYIIPVGGKGHIETPDVPPLSTADYWEITVSFTYQGSAGSYPCLFGYSGGVDYKAPCLTYESGNYRLYLSFNGTGWDFVGNTGIAPQVGSTYKFNVRFTGVAYVVRCSVDGGSMTEVLRYSNSTPVHCSVPLWFMDLSLNNNYATYGELKLFNTSIFIDTDYWWEGVKEVKVPATPDDYDSTTVETEYKVAEETTTQYWKGNPEEVAANPDGLITSDTGGGGWTIYQQGPWYEVWLMLNSQASPSYPRWQTQGLGAVAYLKTPEEGILSKYLTTQWCDPGFDGRICNEWEIQGYKTESDMLSMTNGTVLDHNTWPTRNRGESKTIELDNDKLFQYYTIQMLGRFGSDSYNSIGTTKFYMKYMKEGTPDDYDFITEKTTYKVLSETDTKYWKYEGKTINGTGSGVDWTIDEDNDTFMNIGTASFQTPEILPLATANSWEIGLVARMTSSGTDPCFVGYTGTSDYKAPCLTFSYNTLRVFLSTTGNSWNLASSGDTGIVKEMNRTYYVKYGFTGSTYYVDLHLDGEDTYRRVWSMNSTAKVHCSVPHQFMGLNLNPSHYAVKGVLYLDDVYCKINGDMYWQAVKQDVVPGTPELKYWKYTTIANGYRLLDSIKGNGTQTLDTGIYPKDTTKVQSKFIYSTYSGGSFIGQGGTGEADSFRLFRHQNTTYLDYGSGEGYNRISGTYLASTSDAYEVEFGNRYVKDIPTNTTKFSSSGVSFAQKNFTIQLTSQDDYGTFYYVKIFDGDTLVRDLVPCERASDGMVGMWDNVTNSFLEPSASCIKGDYVLIEGTPDDYDIIQPNWDFTTESHIYKALKVQYVPEHVWERPLTEDGTIGVSDFAVTSSGTNTYLLFDQNPDTDWVKTGAAGWWSEYIEFYIKEGVKLQSLDITNSTQGGTVGNGGAFIQASNDGSNWTDIASNTPIEGQTTAGATWRFNVNSDTTYTYFQMKMLGGSTLRLQEIKINAIQ